VTIIAFQLNLEKGKMSKTTRKEKVEKKRKKIVEKTPKYKNFKQFLEEETLENDVDFKIKNLR